MMNTYCLIEWEVLNTFRSIGLEPVGRSSRCVGSLPAPRGVSDDNFQGQKYKAAIVKVVSKQFENVLVEQNHCHGLAIVMRSFGCVSLVREGRETTHSRPGYTASSSIYSLRQLPSIIICRSRKICLN
jgi:hypothetical protein